MNNMSCESHFSPNKLILLMCITITDILMYASLQPSAAKQIVNFEEGKEGEDKKDLTNFGLRTDIYGKKNRVRKLFRLVCDLQE